MIQSKYWPTIRTAAMLGQEMNPHELANDISAFRFLKGMNDRHIKVLAGCARRIHIEKAAIIFHHVEEGTIELEAVHEFALAGIRM
jgi:hypothetical protein